MFHLMQLVERGRGQWRLWMNVAPPFTHRHKMKTGWKGNTLRVKSGMGIVSLGRKLNNTDY
jgi:hypothetical protein